MILTAAHCVDDEDLDLSGGHVESSLVDRVQALGETALDVERLFECPQDGNSARRPYSGCIVCDTINQERLMRRLQDFATRQGGAMRTLILALLLVGLAAACGGETTAEEAGETATEEAGETATEEAIYGGVAGLTAGACFLQSSTDGGTTYDVVDCGVIHDGEVTTVEDCKPGDDDTRLGAIASYVGVSVAELPDWLNSNELAARENWNIELGSLCYLGAAEGQLTGSYRG